MSSYVSHSKATCSHVSSKLRQIQPHFILLFGIYNISLFSIFNARKHVLIHATACLSSIGNNVLIWPWESTYWRIYCTHKARLNILQKWLLPLIDNFVYWFPLYPPLNKLHLDKLQLEPKSANYQHPKVYPTNYWWLVKHFIINVSTCLLCMYCWKLLSTLVS